MRAPDRGIAFLIILRIFKISYLRKQLVYYAKTVNNARHVMQKNPNIAKSAMMGLISQYQ